MHDFVVYEKSSSVGGTWRDNTYPGLSCDVPSRYYSYSFAPNPDWTHVFSPGPEIDAYLRRVVADLGVERHIRFDSEVARAEWTEHGRWVLRTVSGEEETFDFIVSAAGGAAPPPDSALPGHRVLLRSGLPLGSLGSFCPT